MNNDDDQDAVMEGALLDAVTTRRREFTEKRKECQSQQEEDPSWKNEEKGFACDDLMCSENPRRNATIWESL